MPPRLILRDLEFPFSGWPLVMGILNVTPDSFSDGGVYDQPDAAVARAAEMVVHGAAIIDVGPESTRPGSDPVPSEEQIRRAIPVIAAIRERFPELPISIDTRLGGVAHAALSAGADLVNDVSALRDDPAMVRLIAQTGVSVVLMHRRGTSTDMQKGGGPSYADVVTEVADFLRERVAFATAKGIRPDRILLDPGLGFGKRVEHNLLLMDRLGDLVRLRFPVLVGASRKSFLGSILGAECPEDRVGASIACALMAADAGAAIVRVHDVKETVQALRIRASIRAPSTGVGSH